MGESHPTGGGGCFWEIESGSPDTGSGHGTDGTPVLLVNGSLDGIKWRELKMKGRSGRGRREMVREEGTDSRSLSCR